MSDTKFTKGKWLLRGDEVSIKSTDDNQSYGMMLTIAHIDQYDFKDDYEANAHLIAAAPDMYKSLHRQKKNLQGVLNHLNSNHRANIEHEISLIDNELSRARGE